MGVGLVEEGVEPTIGVADRVEGRVGRQAGRRRAAVAVGVDALGGRADLLQPAEQRRVQLGGDGGAFGDEVGCLVRVAAQVVELARPAAGRADEGPLRGRQR